MLNGFTDLSRRAGNTWNQNIFVSALSFFTNHEMFKGGFQHLCTWELSLETLAMVEASPILLAFHSCEKEKLKKNIECLQGKCCSSE